MDGVMENAGVVCGVLVAAELITRLCPKNKMLGFVRSLTVLVLLASLAAALAGASWGLVLTGGGRTGATRSWTNMWRTNTVRRRSSRGRSIFGACWPLREWRRKKSSCTSI